MRPDGWAHWKRHQPIVKVYLTHLLLFLNQLTESAMIVVALQQVHRLLPFYYCLPKLCPKLLKSCLRVWAMQPAGDDGRGGSRQITLLAFAAIRNLGVTLPYPFVEHCLKGNI